MKYVITFISLRRATPQVVLRALCLCVAEFALGKHQVSRGKKNSFGKHSAVVSHRFVEGVAVTYDDASAPAIDRTIWP